MCNFLPPFARFVSLSRHFLIPCTLFHTIQKDSNRQIFSPFLRGVFHDCSHPQNSSLSSVILSHPYPLPASGFVLFFMPLSLISFHTLKPAFSSLLFLLFFLSFPLELTLCILPVSVSFYSSTHFPPQTFSPYLSTVSSSLCKHVQDSALLKTEL